MYGTVANIRGKAGQGQALIDNRERWNRERKPRISGAMQWYIFRLDRDPQDMILVAVFESKESYEANASDPEQDRWYQELRSHLEADPHWNDGEIFSA